MLTLLWLKIARKNITHFHSIDALIGSLLSLSAAGDLMLKDDSTSDKKRFGAVSTSVT